MSSSNYHNNAHNAHHTTAVEEFHGQPSLNVRSPEDYYSAGEDKAVEYLVFPEPQLPAHSSHLDQTMFQNYDNENLPMPYSHEKESEDYHHDAAAALDPVYDPYPKVSTTDKEDYQHASTSAAVYTSHTEDKVTANDDAQVPESSQVHDNHTVALPDTNGKDQENVFANKRDTLIGEDEHKDEKAALSDEKANKTQRLEDEKRLRAKMEEETKDRVFQPETEPEAVYVPSIKPRTDIAEQNCCWGCLAWICCWTSATADKK